MAPRLFYDDDDDDDDNVLFSPIYFIFICVVIVYTEHSICYILNYCYGAVANAAVSARLSFRTLT